MKVVSAILSMAISTLTE